ncbi:MAG: ABC transporter ATP-binding protein [Candidatus Bathyarchaeia archaeon]|jgi:energy-coupling factor transport system ATP-binding protein
MISTENVSFHYTAGSEVLQNVNLEIKDGEFVAIMGENGAGKTTLVKMFNGLLKPTEGTVLVDGVNTREKSVAQLSRDVGLIFQNPDHQLFAETVADELAFSLRNFGFKEDTIQKRVTSLLTTLDLNRYEKSSPFVLSGGERKRVALAAVLAWDPKHVVMDEPTIGQDYLQKDHLRNFIVQIISQGKAVVIVTHDVEFVAECKPRVVLLSRGKIIADGPTAQILTNTQVVEQASLVMPQIASLMKNLKDLNPPPNIIDAYSAGGFLSGKLKEKLEARAPTQRR